MDRFDCKYFAHANTLLLVAPAGRALPDRASARPRPNSGPARFTLPPALSRLDVDATDLDHRVFRVRERIPVAPGPQVLMFPRWLPGTRPLRAKSTGSQAFRSAALRVP